MKDLTKNLVDIQPQAQLTAEQREILKKRIDLTHKIVDHHVDAMFLQDVGLSVDLPPSFLDVSNPNYRPPTIEEIQAVVGRIKTMGYSTNAIARFTGSPKNGQEGRKVAQWMRKGNIGYCEWRLLLIKSGITIETVLPVAANGDSEYLHLINMKTAMDSITGSGEPTKES